VKEVSEVPGASEAPESEPDRGVRPVVVLPSAVEVLALVALSVLVAVLEVLYLPVHVGAVAVPVGALAAAVTNPVLVWAAAEGTDRTLVAAAPLGAWLLTLGVLVVPGPGGDVLLVGDWRALALIVLGVVPATLVLGGHVGTSAVRRAQLRR